MYRLHLALCPAAGCCCWPPVASSSCASPMRQALCSVILVAGEPMDTYVSPRNGGSTAQHSTTQQPLAHGPWALQASPACLPASPEPADQKHQKPRAAAAPACQPRHLRRAGVRGPGGQASCFWLLFLAARQPRGQMFARLSSGRRTMHVVVSTRSSIKRVRRLDDGPGSHSAIVTALWWRTRGRRGGLGS